MDHGFAAFGNGRGGFGPRGGGFGPRGGGFGPRFGFAHHHHRHHIHPYAFPHGPHHGAPFFETPDLEDTEDSMPENTEEISGEESHVGHCKKDKHLKKEKCKYLKKVMKDKKNKMFKKFLKNSIDPVGTTVTNQDGKFTISMDVGMEAKAEDVKVNVREHDIYIEIKMVKWSEDRTSVLSQVFTKKVTLPEEAKVDDITSNLTPEGILKIETPVAVPEVVIECSVLPGTNPVAEN